MRNVTNLMTLRICGTPFLPCFPKDREGTTILHGDTGILKLSNEADQNWRKMVKN